MTNTYILGQVVQIRDVISDPSTLQLVDDNTIAVTVYRPDGTTTVPSVSRLSAGTYVATVLPNLTGWWEYVFLSTGLGAGAGPGRFYVSPVP